MCTCELCDKDVSIVIRGHFTTKGYCIECHADMETEAVYTYLDEYGIDHPSIPIEI